MIRKKSFAIICSLCLTLGLLIPGLSFANTGGEQGQDETCTVKITVQNNDASVGSVKYKIQDGENLPDEWTEISLTSPAGANNLSGEISVPAGSFIMIKAVPAEGYGIDDERGVKIRFCSDGEFQVVGGAIDKLVSGDGMKVNVADDGYELEFGFKETNQGGGGGENPPAEGNRFDIALDNVNANGMLPESLGIVQYAVVTEYAQTQINPVNMNVDYDGEADDITMTVGNTGGDSPKVKYTYTVKDTAKQFKLYVIPAKGKTATITRDNQGNMEVVDQVSWKPDAPSFTIKNVPAGEFYRVEFSDTGSQPGGNTDGSDVAPAVDAASIQFYDRFNNNFTYEEFKRANLGTVQYSTDGGINWNEFSAEQVNSDEKLLWYTDKSDEEPANWKQIYYFKNEDAVNVQLKVTQGSLCYKISNGNVTNITNNTALSNLVKSGQILSIFPQDDGVRNITWSDDAEAEDQRVENGKVIIEKAVIGDENALITDAPYSQQGNKGYVGIKGGATVTVKLIPDYGYQVGTLELNGQRLTPQDEEATYTFTMPDNNLHLRAIFDASNDEINTTADGVNGGQIEGGENVIDSGNLRLLVSDSNMTDAQKAKMQDSAAAEDTDILSYLEVDLEKFVNKGDSGQEWIEDLEELSEKIKITLNVGKNLDKNKTYVVVREHEGVYEQIPAIYDQDAGTLTFESDKFSDYALATIDKGGAVAGTDSAETGDNSNMAPWILIMLAAAAGLTGTVVYRKRKTQ